MDSTKLIIRDLRLNMGIGVFESEKAASQPVLVNVTADVDRPEDWRKDAYVQVTCYAKIVEAIRAMAASGHIHLAETFAEMIAEHCLGTPGIAGVTVRVEKTAIFPDIAAVGVEIRRERH
jgi:dihydroneopterin aldolase